MWAASAAPPVAAVIVLERVAAVDLMKVAGHVTVGATKITATNGLRLFLHDQYLAFNTKGTNATRRDFLAGVVEQLITRLNAAHVSQDALGRALADAAAGRHLLAWSAHTDVQRAWSSLGVGGVVPDDSVTFALQNRGGNKLDYFQNVSAIAKAKVSRAGNDISMDFVITNSAPLGEPAYILGPQPGSIVTKAGEYAGIASINVPAKATDVRLTGGDFALVSGPDGNTQVVSQWLQIPRGGVRRLHLRFRLPANMRTLTIEPSARQPGVLWHIGSLAWTDTKAQTITW
jgi:hypothetical protein